MNTFVIFITTTLLYWIIRFSVTFNIHSKHSDSQLSSLILGGVFYLLIVVGFAVFYIISIKGTLGFSHHDNLTNINNGFNIAKVIKSISFPFILFILINAILVQGYTGFSGFLNIINASFILGYIPIYFLSSLYNHWEYIGIYSWVSLILLILYGIHGLFVS